MGSRKEFVDFIKEELIKRSWSHAELARRSGISQAHISRVINGDYQPGLDFYKSISFALDIPEELIFRTAGELPENKAINPNQKILLKYFLALDVKEQELVLDFTFMLKNRKK